jgi:transcriptional regulator with XRE-family HTH domain
LPDQTAFVDQAKRLDDRREELRMSVGKLARIADVNFDTAKNALQGLRKPRQDTLYLLCAALRLKLYWVLEGEGEREADDSDVEKYRLLARPPSQTNLAPVTSSSLGIDRWLTDTAVGRSATPDEREWLRKFPWLSAQVRYPDLVYSTALHLFREMLGNTAEESGRAQNT